MTGDRKDDDTDTLTLLVPFHVNGALPAEERARMDAALAADPALRAELQAAQEIAGLVQRGGAELAPVPVSLQARLLALLARLEARPAAARAPGWFWRPAFAAAAVVVVVQAAVLGYQGARRTAFETLAGPTEAAPPSDRLLLLRLAPDAPWAEVEALLSSRGLTIVGGPRGASLDVAVAPGARIDEEVRVLRASPLVEFAGAAA